MNPLLALVVALAKAAETCQVTAKPMAPHYPDCLDDVHVLSGTDPQATLQVRQIRNGCPLPSKNTEAC